MASSTMIQSFMDTLCATRIVPHNGRPNVLCLPYARADESSTIESYSNYKYLILFKSHPSLIPLNFGLENILGIDLDMTEDEYLESILKSYYKGIYINSAVYFDMVFDSEDAFVEHALIDAGLNTADVHRWLFETTNHNLLYEDVIRDYTDMQWKDTCISERLLDVLHNI